MEVAALAGEDIAALKLSNGALLLRAMCAGQHQQGSTQHQACADSAARQGCGSVEFHVFALRLWWQYQARNMAERRAAVEFAPAQSSGRFKTFHFVERN
jgi:hypothetical protein